VLETSVMCKTGQSRPRSRVLDVEGDPGSRLFEGSSFVLTMTADKSGRLLALVVLPSSNSLRRTPRRSLACDLGALVEM
jgi:hypothetical protein